MFYRCIVISFIIAIVAAFISMTVLTAPAEGEMMPDLSYETSVPLSKMTQAEMNAYIQEMPVKKVTGLKRFTYQFSHPQVWFFAFQSVLTWFCGLLAATLLVSVWQRRAVSAPN